MYERRRTETRRENGNVRASLFFTRPESVTKLGLKYKNFNQACSRTDTWKMSGNFAKRRPWGKIRSLYASLEAVELCLEKIFRTYTSISQMFRWFPLAKTYNRIRTISRKFTIIFTTVTRWRWNFRDVIPRYEANRTAALNRNGAFARNRRHRSARLSNNFISNRRVVYKVKAVGKDLASCHPKLAAETRYGEVIIILPEIEWRTYILVVLLLVAE